MDGAIPWVSGPGFYKKQVEQAVRTKSLDSIPVSVPTYIFLTLNLCCGFSQ